MKKNILISTLCLFLAISIPAVADANNVFQATEVDYPIVVNGSIAELNLPVVLINNRTYLPLRSICEILKTDIHWNEQDRRVEIVTEKDLNADTSIGIGIHGRNGWESFDSLDFQLSKETAIIIADEIYLQMYGSDYLKETKVAVDSSADANYFIVYRYREPIALGGWL